MATELTKVQAALLHVIRTFWAEKGYPPAQRELGRLMAKSLCSIQSGLERLARKGYVTWDRGVSRSLRVAGCEASAGQAVVGGEPIDQRAPGPPRPIGRKGSVHGELLTSEADDGKTKEVAINGTPHRNSASDAWSTPQQEPDESILSRRAS